MIGPAAHAAVAADGIVKAANGQLVGATLTAGSDTATLILYDNASAASGTKLATLKAAANTTASFTPAVPYVATKGIYADIDGTGPVATVVYL